MLAIQFATEVEMPSDQHPGDRQERRHQHDAPDTVLVRLLRQLTVETDRFAEMFGDAHGLHRTDLNALVAILDTTRRGDSISPGQLAHALHLSASATTAVLDRLENAGHIERDRSPDDRRRIQLLMPEKAIRLGEQFFRPLGMELSRAWASFTTDERATIARFLTTSIEATITVRTRLLANEDTNLTQGNPRR